MNNNSNKIFFDFWPVIDNPQTFPFYSIIIDDEEKIIIQNLLFEDNFTWISNNKVDFSIINKLSNNNKIILNYSSEMNNQDYTINLPSEYKISLLETAVVYESTNKNKQLFSQDKFCIRKALSDDINHLITIKDSSMNHDYINQIADAYNDKDCDLYILQYEKTPVSFLILTDIVSLKFDYCYKHISTIYTIPQYRHQGFALYLTQSIMNLYADKSFIYVSDSISNIASNNLAISCGFSISGYNHQAFIQKM